MNLFNGMNDQPSLKGSRKPSQHCSNVAANEIQLTAPTIWHQPTQHCQHHNVIFVPNYFMATTVMQCGINHIYYKYQFEKFLTCQKMNRLIRKSNSAQRMPTAAV